MPADLLSDLIIMRLWAVNQINLQPSEPVKRDNRERWAIAIKTAGQTVYTSQGQDYLSDPGHVVVLPQGISYSWACSEPGECIMFEFDARPQKRGFVPLCIRVGNPAEITGLARKAALNWVFRRPAYLVKCLASLYEIVGQLADAGPIDYAASSRQQLILPAVRHLEKHYNQPGLNNDTLAELSGVSTVYFRKLFTAIYKVSPMKYVQAIRIAKAKDMLIGEYCPIAHVAEAVGFDNIYHFSKTFKKLTGSTPTEYARMHRIGKTES